MGRDQSTWFGYVERWHETNRVKRYIEHECDKTNVSIYEKNLGLTTAITDYTAWVGGREALVR